MVIRRGVTGFVGCSARLKCWVRPDRVRSTGGLLQALFLHEAS
jgi:hypothetical protein